ncbi:hypothetical protein, partial [Mycobacterium sp. MUNTM1]
LRQLVEEHLETFLRGRFDAGCSRGRRHNDIIAASTDKSGPRRSPLKNSVHASPSPLPDSNSPALCTHRESRSVSRNQLALGVLHWQVVNA